MKKINDSKWIALVIASSVVSVNAQADILKRIEKNIEKMENKLGELNDKANYHLKNAENKLVYFGKSASRSVDGSLNRLSQKLLPELKSKPEYTKSTNPKSIFSRLFGKNSIGQQNERNIQVAAVSQSRVARATNWIVDQFKAAYRAMSRGVNKMFSRSAR